MRNTFITLVILAISTLAYGQDTETPEYTLRRYIATDTQTGKYVNKIDTIWKYKTLYPVGGNRKPVSFLEIIRRLEKLENGIDSLSKPKLFTANILSISNDCKDSTVVEWKKVTMFTLINFEKNIYQWQTGWLKEERIVKVGECRTFTIFNKPSQTYYYPDKKKKFTSEVLDYRILK